MTENMYEHGKIYKIVDAGYNMCYYGSTVQSLANRMAGHRADYIQYKNNNKKHIASVAKIFDEYGIENCKIELVELFPCTNKMELHKKEGEYIRNNACVNKLIAGRTDQEYKADNKEKLLAYARAYHNANRDKLNENRKVWEANHKDERKEYKKTKDKEYRDNNREEILRKKKEYYQATKERFRAKKAQYRQDHREESKEYYQKYSKDNADKRKEYYRNYYLENRETLYAKERVRVQKKKAEQAQEPTEEPMQEPTQEPTQEPAQEPTQEPTQPPS